MKQIILVTVALLIFSIVSAQPVPGKEENIPFLVTFSKGADKSHGDDDHVQTFFFKIPKDYKKPFYIRVYDPDCGGKHDENIAGFNSKTKFSLYGGPKAYSDEDAQKVQPVGNYRSGNHIISKTFGVNSSYDGKWYTFGPFNPSEGEYVKELGGHVFKLICEGLSGDDGNLYRYFLSASGKSNIPVNGGNAFTFEYTVRLHDNPQEVSHIYPFITEDVVSVIQHNFDWDSDGKISIYSRHKTGEPARTSQDGNWMKSKHKIVEKEKNGCLDLQFIKNKPRPAKNNNVVFYVTNQYGKAVAFYAVPIGYTPSKSIIVE